MRAVPIFDLDGLLIDSEPLFFRAYRDALASHGLELTMADFAAHWTRDGKGIREFISDRGWNLQADQVKSERKEGYRALIQDFLRPMPGAQKLLESVKGRTDMALVTSSSREDVEYILTRLDWKCFFDVVITEDDGYPRKPSPNMFSAAVAQLKAAPSQCVILEDARKGLVAALAAGIKCVVVPNQFTCTNDFSGATSVLPSLEKITPEYLDTLVAEVLIPESKRSGESTNG